jgi:general secretion pathway protein I
MRRRGFTLLEVLVALAVFALAAVVLGSTYVNILNAYRLVDRGDARDEEIRFARALLLAEPDRTKAEEGGDFESPSGNRVSWRAEIEPSSTADVFQVSFTCEVSERNPTEPRRGTGPQRPTTETFMLLRPTWSEGLDMAKLRQDAKDRIIELRRKER